LLYHFFNFLVMNRRDLLKLKENIYSLGETINAQEGFYRDVNGFLRQVYPSQSSVVAKTGVTHFSPKKNCWATPSADEQTNHTSVLSL
jgi:hypothetical protein